MAISALASLSTRSFCLLSAAFWLITGGGLPAPVAAEPTQKTALPAEATAEAQAVLGRLGVDTRLINLSLKKLDKPYYRVRTDKGHLSVEGDSAVALVHGAVRYLGRQGALAVSWEGSRRQNLAFAPGYDSGEVTSPFGLRTYLNPCTFGYTSVWWDWTRWEQEIDWMAAHGIDTPLAMEGQEYVWRALWREEGLSDTAIADGFSAAPFLPWQRMGNIAGYRAPLSTGWIDKKHALQKRILERMRGLGMKPILPAFAGYVPKAFAERHPEARIYQMREWEGFPGTYWLDPSDPLFARIAKRFIALYNETYGPGQYYLLDAFNEMVPPIAEDGSDARQATYGDSTANTPATRAAALPAEVRSARLAAYGERLYQSVTEAAPGATWVMQGWLFGADKHFWTPDAIAAFLSKVPDDRMLILDIGNDRYPGIWQSSNAFDGKHWIYGYVHNYGGSNPVYGDLSFYRTDMEAVLRHPGRGSLAGFGMFPEGLHNNGIVYDYAYDLAWGELAGQTGAPPVESWLSDRLRARYGTVTPALLDGWNKVIAGAFSTRYWTPRWWEKRAGAYLFFKRPTLAGSDYPAPPGDAAQLRAGIDALLAQASGLGAEPLYLYDLIDLTGHYASLKLDEALKQAIAAYKAGDLAAGDRAAARVEALARQIDSLLGNQQETLGSWIDDARAYGDTPAEKQHFAQDAKAIVTLWGGTGNLSDYASRAWQGLYAGYYLPRWQRFLNAARQAAVTGKPLDEAAVKADIKAWEQGWLSDGNLWPRQRPASPLAALRTLLAEVDRP